MVIVRKASANDAEDVHRMLSSIPWMVDYERKEIRDRCESGKEVWVVEVEGEVVSMMMLRLDSLAHSLGHKELFIPILTTLEQHRRKNYARLLVRLAKDEATKIGATIEGYPENDKSLALLNAEGFELIEGRRDNRNNDLYRWSPEASTAN